MARRLTGRTPVRGMVGHVVVVGLTVIVLTVLVAAVVDTGSILSAGVGSVTVLVVVLVGVLGVASVLRGVAGLALAGAAVVYLGQLVLLAVVIAVVRDASWLVGPAFAAAAMAQTLSSQVALVIGYARARHELTDTPLAPR
ncbi:MAG: hypothetical protein ACRCY8_11720 [Dermatophilaceae bacterium]